MVGGGCCSCSIKVSSYATWTGLYGHGGWPSVRFTGQAVSGGFRALFERRKSVLNRELDQSGGVADAKLVHQAAAVGVHRLGRKVQRLGDLRAGMPFRDQLQDLPLAPAQAFQGARHGAPADAFRDGFRDLVAYVAVADADGAYGIDDFPRRRALEHVTLSARSQR